MSKYELPDRRFGIRSDLRELGLMTPDHSAREGALKDVGLCLSDLEDWAFLDTPSEGDPFEESPGETFYDEREIRLSEEVASLLNAATPIGRWSPKTLLQDERWPRIAALCRELSALMLANDEKEG